ncbi:hypothetical protein ACFQ6C_25930 [Streptomyces sp. NPDC056454]|uniref:hypothetical protein n=1 Tax=Streptomyces sp. NPDC056454 TaxID=3345823 RepID=UPI0036ADD41C
MSQHPNEDVLQRVTLTFMPHGGYPQDRHFDHVTPDDLVFVLGAFAGRKRRSLSGRAEVVAALDAARKGQLEWHEEQLRRGVEEGLGRWRHLVPRWVRMRAVDRLVEEYYLSTAQWAAEMGDLYAQVEALHHKVARVPAAPRGPMVLCAECTRAVPLSKLTCLDSVGWTSDDDGRPRCPEHPVATPSLASLVKAGS